MSRHPFPKAIVDSPYTRRNKPKHAEYSQCDHYWCRRLLPDRSQAQSNILLTLAALYAIFLTVAMQKANFQVTCIERPSSKTATPSGADAKTVECDDVHASTAAL
jgi:hypothetical protein